MKSYYAMLVKFENDIIKKISIESYRFPKKLGSKVNNFGVDMVVGAISDNESELIEYSNKLIKLQNKKVRNENKKNDLEFWAQFK